MKKVLLSIACASAMVASAQVAKIQNETRVVGKTSKLEVAKNAVLSDTKKANGPLKAAADGVYYKTPAGSLWSFVEMPMYTYNTPANIVAPWTLFSYTNMSAKKDGKWGIQTASSFIDMTEETDDENNLWNSYFGGVGNYYSVQYTEGDITYIPTHTTRDGKANTLLTSISGVSLGTFHPTNVDGVTLYTGGSLENGNLYGGGTYQGLISVGIDQSYPKPMSPLYVEYVHVWGILLDKTQDPLSGKTLTMKIYNLEDENADPVVLTATPEECVFDSEANFANFYQVKFTQKTVDEISGEIVAEPFVIDYPAEVIITGCEQTGVNLGFTGYTVTEEFLSDNTEENQTFLLLYDPTDGKMYNLRYTNNVIALGFQSMFDVCTVETEILSQDNTAYEANGIAVSADGQTFGNNRFKDINGVVVYTAIDWKDETTEEEMYWSDDMYDYEWIQNLVVDDSDYKDYRYYMVGAVCDPLPAGVDKRYAVIHLNGRGVVSGDIYVLQGDITLEEAKADHVAAGIENVNSTVKANANNKKYNFAGQQVGESFKGIVISNNKKVVKK